MNVYGGRIKIFLYLNKLSTFKLPSWSPYQNYMILDILLVQYCQLYQFWENENIWNSKEREEQTIYKAVTEGISPRWK